MRSQSPVLFPFRGSSAGRLSPLHDLHAVIVITLPLLAPPPSPTLVDHKVGSAHVIKIAER